MRKLKIILAACMLFLFMVPTTVYAEEDYDSTYKIIMDTALAKFYIKAQPSDAIPLDLITVLDNTYLGKAEAGVYYNLPRLKNMYYYKVVDTESWYIDERALYPALSLKNGVTSSSNAHFTLQILSTTNNSVQASCDITILEQLQGVPREEIASVSVIQQGLENSPIGGLACPSKYLYGYNPALHKSALVTEGSVYVYDSGWTGKINDSISYDNTTGTITSLDSHLMDVNSWIIRNPRNVVEYSSYGLSAGDISINVKPFCLSSEGGLFVTDSEQYNANTGVLSAGASPEATYLLVSNNQAIVHQYNPDTTQPQDNFKISTEQGYSYTYDQLTNGNLATIPEDEFQFYPNTGKYTAKAGATLNIPLYAPGPSLLNYQTEISGTTGNRPVNPPTADKTTYTLRFDYTGGMGLSYRDVTPGVDPQLPSPTKNGYTFQGWYVDQALTKEYDYRTFNYVLGGTYTLYSKWEVIGNYTVRFYDDKNNTDRTSNYSVGVQPELPENPRFTGYNFKNWTIVDNTSAATGTIYDPSTFSPKNGDSYIFKAMWDVAGVILSVTPTQTEYWVGDAVDKSKLVVMVQTDSNGTTKTLSVDEFSVTPATIERNGNNNITIRYDATGATAVTTLTGKADYITGLAATYQGEDLFVGDAIPTGSIVCKLTYKSTKVVDTSEFSINPSTIRAAGTNTITVTSSGYSTSITINGKKRTADGNTENNGRGTLSSITASYTGKQLSVGDTIEPSDIKVTARYADGSSSEVSSTAFNYSPNFVRNAGTNTINVTYQDKSCTFNISATNNSASTNTQPSSTRTPSTINGNTGTNNNGTTTNGNRGSNTSTSGYDGASTIGSGGYSVNGTDSKGTSSGYLGGKNILDQLGGGQSKALVNDRDILREINEAQKNATSINITLINTASGNILDSEMVDALISKGLTLNITMVSPSDKSTRVGYWSFDGNTIDPITTPIDLNFKYEQISKKAENMYKITLDAQNYHPSVVCKAIMRDAYVAGTYVNLYACDSENGNSRFIQNLMWSSTLELTLPLSMANTFITTDYAEKYEDGSTLSEEPFIERELPDTEITKEEDIESTANGNVEESEINNNAEETKGSINLKFILIPSVLIIMLLLAVSVIVFIRKRGLIEDDMDTIPDYNGEPIGGEDEQIEVDDDDEDIFADDDEGDLD